MYLVKIMQGRMLLDFDVTDDIVAWEATAGKAWNAQFKGAKFTVYDLGMHVAAIYSVLSNKPKSQSRLKSAGKDAE